MGLQQSITNEHLTSRIAQLERSLVTTMENVTKLIDVMEKMTAIIEDQKEKINTLSQRTSSMVLFGGKQ